MTDTAAARKDLRAEFADFREEGEPVFVAVRPPAGAATVDVNLLPLVDYLFAPRAESRIVRWLFERGLPLNGHESLVKSQAAVRVQPGGALQVAEQLAGVRIVADCEPVGDMRASGFTDVRRRDGETTALLPGLSEALFAGDAGRDIPGEIRAQASHGYRREFMVGNMIVAELDSHLRWRNVHLEWADPAPAKTTFGPVGFCEAWFDGNRQDCIALVGEVDRSGGPGNFHLVGQRAEPQPIPVELVGLYEFLSVPRWQYEVAAYFDWAGLTSATLFKLMLSGVVVSVKTRNPWAAVKSLRGYRIAPLSTVEATQLAGLSRVFQRDGSESVAMSREPATEVIWGGAAGSGDDLPTRVKAVAARSGVRPQVVAEAVMERLPDLFDQSLVRLEPARLR